MAEEIKSEPLDQETQGTVPSAAEVEKRIQEGAAYKEGLLQRIIADGQQKPGLSSPGHPIKGSRGFERS